MKYKKISRILMLAVLFSLMIYFENNISAMSAPYLSLNIDEDVVTNDNAILNAKLNNIERKLIEAFEITIYCDNVEVIKCKKTVNDNSREINVRFDLNKEARAKLESNKKYDYTISAITKEDVNDSMYTAKHHFTTQSVKVVTVNEKVKSDTAILNIIVDNPNKEYIKTIGVKIFLGDKLVKDYYKTINQSDKNFELSFDIKTDAAFPLKNNTKYDYLVYAEIDVSQSYLYNALAICEGEIRTLGKTCVKTNVYKNKKTITLKNKINNPYLKKISKIKVILKSGKKQQVVYNKKIAKKKQYLRNLTIKIKLKKTRIKKIAKAKKYKYITYVTIGGKLYKAKGKMKIE